MTTADRIRAVIARELEVDASTLAGDVTFEAMGVDSLAMVEMLFAIEDEFKVRIPPAAAEGISTIDTLADVVDALSTPHAAIAA